MYVQSVQILIAVYPYYAKVCQHAYHADRIHSLIKLGDYIIRFPVYIRIMSVFTMPTCIAHSCVIYHF